MCAFSKFMNFKAILAFTEVNSRSIFSEFILTECDRLKYLIYHAPALKWTSKKGTNGSNAQHISYHLPGKLSATSLIELALTSREITFGITKIQFEVTRDICFIIAIRIDLFGWFYIEDFNVWCIYMVILLLRTHIIHQTICKLT